MGGQGHTVEGCEPAALRRMPRVLGPWAQRPGPAPHSTRFDASQKVNFEAVSQAAEPGKA